MTVGELAVSRGVISRHDLAVVAQCAQQEVDDLARGWIELGVIGTESDNVAAQRALANLRPSFDVHAEARSLRIAEAERLYTAALEHARTTPDSSIAAFWNRRAYVYAQELRFLGGSEDRAQFILSAILSGS